MWFRPKGPSVNRRSTRVTLPAGARVAFDAHCAADDDGELLDTKDRKNVYAGLILPEASA